MNKKTLKYNEKTGEIFYGEIPPGTVSSLAAMRGSNNTKAISIGAGTVQTRIPFDIDANIDSTNFFTVDTVNSTISPKYRGCYRVEFTVNDNAPANVGFYAISKASVPTTKYSPMVTGTQTYSASAIIPDCDAGDKIYVQFWGYSNNPGFTFRPTDSTSRPLGGYPIFFTVTYMGPQA